MPNRACSAAVNSRRAVVRQRRRPAACRGCRRRSRTTRPASSRKTAGAKGRNDFAVLDLEVEHRTASWASAASPRIERLPSARGPNSIRPWNQPTTFSSAIAAATSSTSASSSSSSVVRADRCRGRRDLAVGIVARARDRRRHARRGRRVRAAGARAMQMVRRRAPRRARRRRRRPPAGSRCRSNCPSRSTLPLATQLSATPPARHRFVMPVSRGERAGQPQHDLLGDRLDRRGEVHLALRQIAISAAARRAAEQRVEPLVGHRQPGAVVEVAHGRARNEPSGLRSIRWSRMS